MSNVTLTTPAAGSALAFRLVGGVHFARSAMGWGSATTFTDVDDDDASRLPVRAKDIEDLVGALADAAWTTGPGSLIALLKAIATQANSTAPAAVKLAQDEYKPFAASATTVLGASGAVGDYLAGLSVQPGSTSPGSIVVKDGATTIYTFPGGATSVGSLAPFTIPIGAKSVNGAWSVVAGANVSGLGVGDFT